MSIARHIFMMITIKCTDTAYIPVQYNNNLVQSLFRPPWLGEAAGFLHPHLMDRQTSDYDNKQTVAQEPQTGDKTIM